MLVKALNTPVAMNSHHTNGIIIRPQVISTDLDSYDLLKENYQ